MKAAGIIRIIVGLVIAVLLTAILVVLLTGNNIFSRFGWNNDWIDRFTDRTTYSSGGVNEDSNDVMVSDKASVDATNIKKIKIDWVAGSVNLRVGTGNEIVFSESSYRNLTDKQKMRYSISDSGVLEIHFRADLDNIFNWFRLDANMPEKTLTVDVPASLMAQLEKLEIETVSSNIDLSGVYGTKTDLSTVSGAIHCADISTQEVELSTTSGAIVCENTTADKIEIDNVSGSILAEGEFQQVKADTVSGEIKLAFANQPENISAHSVSGNIQIALPEGANFSAKLDTVSGTLSCAFAGTLGSDLVVVGDGEAVYRFSTVSGNLEIEKN
ncbi:MAG: DUF4097 family beta strand repeat-containing protein [Eubacteriales bacterium]|nr:DUF4097 family beta strand repeat-containing protein [Eubacteriales bacterium]